MRKLFKIVFALSFLLTSFMVLQGPSIASETASGKRSGGLAGSRGDVRRAVMFAMGTTGGCMNRYKGYVAASGHSAYVSTPMYGMEGYHCGTAINAASQKAAEERALRECNNAKKRWKPKTGPCEVMMSK
jgi:hypothetical protein